MSNRRKSAFGAFGLGAALAAGTASLFRPTRPREIPVEKPHVDKKVEKRKAKRKAQRRARRITRQNS